MKSLRKQLLGKAQSRQRENIIDKLLGKDIYIYLFVTLLLFIITIVYQQLL